MQLSSLSYQNFVKEASLGIQGNFKSYIHQSESSDRITKKFGEKSNCQPFSFNECKPGLVRFHSGTVNELEVIKPRGDVEYQKRYLQ